ncbi:hypothetical protein OQA88_12957 [Cercophora sp. LCS_1]
MPMFQESFDAPEAETNVGADQGTQHSDPIPIQSPEGHRRSLSRRISEESIRTELCEGPIPDSPPKPATPEQAVNNAVSDRAELIERLKRGESPTWIPNRHFESLFQHNKPTSSPPRTPQHSATSPSLLPPPTITPEKDAKGEEAGRDPLQEGLNIERPRSALHSGNFTPEESSPPRQDGHVGSLGGEQRSFQATTPWMATSPPRDYSPFTFSQGTTNYRRDAFNPSGTSSLSSSFASSFAYKPPTSPLVQSEVNEDLDLSLPLNSINIATASPSPARRHTLQLHLLSQSSPYGNTSGHPSIAPRREGALPYQAHQPRRSLNSTPNFSFVGSSPQTPAFLRSRRPSFSSEISPMQHASMVGSYEESILRGRMSTTPSKPLEFMAQIGVLGLGKCKPSLRCPSHVTLPFSAVFYSYASTAHGRSSKTEDGPSPYVGQIDLENGLHNPDEDQRSRRKLHARLSAQAESTDEPGVRPRRPKSPKAPPGGRYRIPEKGQLQIIIKNQNKTAVKLFLVPYDLAGMEPGTKTFVRQRSYSAGPIIENVPDAGAASGGEDRPILRYLIHLHICCPSKGRFYLYKSVRVVFANRVPDGKERLRNEITYPEPRFSPYKPVRVMHPPMLSGAALKAEKAFRRRSSGFNLGQFEGLDGFGGASRGAEERNEWFGEPEAMTGLVMTGEVGGYDKLAKGDAGYGGTVAGAEGLLSKRLRSLGVQMGEEEDGGAKL